MKIARHSKIIELVDHYDIETQEELASRLNEAGFRVTQATVSRDIRELMGFEKVTAVSNSVFYPRWLENGMELCLETLDHLLTKLPVYELSCRPDEDAVKLTEETIFGK